MPPPVPLGSRRTAAIPPLRDGDLAKKLPIEGQVLKLLGDGLGDKEVAEKVGTTPNHVWPFARHPAFGRSRSGS